MKSGTAMCIFLVSTAGVVCSVVMPRPSLSTPAAPSRRRLVVASPFDREFDVMAIKLEEASSVDRFVVCESDRSQAGYPRSWSLGLLQGNVERCRTSCGTQKRNLQLGWECEDAPRAAALEQACRDEGDDTLVFLTDADEIISAATYDRIRHNPPPRGTVLNFRSTMSVHLYGFFWQDPTARYSTARVADCWTWRKGIRRTVDDRGPHSGWHCSYCFPVDEYLSKIHAMMKNDGPLSLSDYYWSQEQLWSLRQSGMPLNSDRRLKHTTAPLPKLLWMYPYLSNNSQLENLPPPTRPTRKCQ